MLIDAPSRPRAATTPDPSHEGRTVHSRPPRGHICLRTGFGPPNTLGFLLQRDLSVNGRWYSLQAIAYSLPTGSIDLLEGVAVSAVEERRTTTASFLSVRKDVYIQKLVATLES